MFKRPRSNVQEVWDLVKETWFKPYAKGFEIMESKKLKGSYPHANGIFFDESKSMNFLVFYI
jgi:hypothetical protein